MARFVRVLIFLIAAMAGGGTARADLAFQSDVTEDGLRYIFVSGEFDFADDLSRFTFEVARGAPTVVSFDSPGGNVAKAMELGRLIRSLGLATLQFRQFQCASSCALAFMGGMYRVAEPGAIGVHRSYFDEDVPVSTAEAVQSIQALTAKIIAYMTEMGIDPALLELSLSYGSDDLRYLSKSEMARYRVTTADVPKVDQSSTSAAAPTTNFPAPPAAPSQDRSQEVSAFVQSILDWHGLPPLSALERVTSAYAGEIHYYGKMQGLADVLKDKRAYFDRWPERAYVVRPGTVNVDCSGEVCQVSGIYDWSVRSLARNRQASGAATFTYVVNMTAGLIIGETSKVLDR